MKQKGYKKTKMIERVNTWLSKISTLPLQPKEIIFVGSFLRDNEFIGDLDLIIKFEPESEERFEAFTNYFPFRNRYLKPTTDDRYYEFYQFMNDLEYQAIYGLIKEQVLKLDYDEQIELEKEHGKKINLKQFLDKNPTILGQIEKRFEIDSELVYYCNWTEVTGRAFDGKTIGDFEISLFFKRMFCGRAKGVEIHTEQHFGGGYVGITLWSKELLDFDLNYQNFINNDLNQYLQRELLHMIKSLDRWIEKFQEIPNWYSEQLKKVHQFAISDLEKLKEEFQSAPEVADSKILNLRCNDIRARLKEISERVSDAKKEM